MARMTPRGVESSTLGRKAAGKQLVSVASMLLILALADGPRTSSAFPSLFNRTPFAFRRQQQQQVAPPQQQQQHGQEQLVSLAASPHSQLAANYEQGGGLQFRNQAAAAELMRLAGAGAPQLQPLALAALQAAPARIHAQHQYVGQAAQHTYTPAGGHYHGKLAAQLAPPEHQSMEESQLELIDHSAAGPADSLLAARRPQQQSWGANGGRLQQEPTHTSEIVDKIEHHIGHQIEQGLGDEQQQQQHGKQLYQQREKTAAASDESASSEPESESAAGHEEAHSEGAEAELEKPEKRHSAEESHHSKHEEHQHEQPPEAFEVHHKKGGKSFQYFHQGHGHGHGHGHGARRR